MGGDGGCMAESTEDEIDQMDYEWVLVSLLLNALPHRITTPPIQYRTGLCMTIDDVWIHSGGLIEGSVR